ncbi:MAG: hypothetical protein IKK34_12430 [Clostridia bacterium]|nr:hypothetical protein [Clostridia bacterium]
MRRHGKKLVCCLMLGAMLLLLTGCSSTDAVNGIAEAMIYLREAVATEESATAAPAPAATAAPEAAGELLSPLEEDELPWIPA